MPENSSVEHNVTFYCQGRRLAGVLRLPTTASPEVPAPGVVMCAGMSLTKEVWLPPHSERLNAAGYATLNFDYTGFGGSEGEPRRRLDPQQQVRDCQAALTWMQAHPAIDGDRLALYGVSLGASVATACAGVDERPRAMVAVAGPMDLGRVWSAFDGFDGFADKVRASHQRFVTEGEVTYISVPRLLAGDPATVSLLEADAPNFPSWDPTVTFESLQELFAFRPEATAATISPTAALWIAPEKDELIAKFELASVHAAARQPKRLVVLKGAEHVDVYRVDGAFEEVLAEALRWFDEHL